MPGGVETQPRMDADGHGFINRIERKRFPFDQPSSTRRAEVRRRRINSQPAFDRETRQSREPLITQSRQAEKALTRILRIRFDRLAVRHPVLKQVRQVNGFTFVAGSAAGEMIRFVGDGGQTRVELFLQFLRGTV